jgi:hypothetical protein
MAVFGIAAQDSSHGVGAEPTSDERDTLTCTLRMDPPPECVLLPTMVGQRRMNTVQHRRYTPEQVIRKLREADKLLAEGTSIATVAKHLELGRPQPASVAPTHPTTDRVIALGKQSRQSLRYCQPANAALPTCLL